MLYLVFLGYANLNLATVSHSPLHKHAKSQIKRTSLMIGLFWAPPIFSFALGLAILKLSVWWFFWWSHSFVNYDICFRLLLCPKGKFIIVVSFLVEGLMFCARCDCLELFIKATTLTKTPWCCHHRVSQLVFESIQFYSIGFYFFCLAIPPHSLTYEECRMYCRM